MFESITSRRKKQQVFVILVFVLCKEWGHFSLLRLQIRSKSTLYYRNCPEKVTKNQYSKAALPPPPRFAPRGGTELSLSTPVARLEKPALRVTADSVSRHRS